MTTVNTTEGRRRGTWPPPLIVATLALLAGQLLIGRRLALPMAAITLLSAAGVIGMTMRRWRVAATALLAFAWGNWCAARVVNPTFPPDHLVAWSGQDVVLEAQMLADPDLAPQRARFRLEAARIVAPDGAKAVHGRVLLTVRICHEQWFGGDRVRVRARLRRPRNFGNPGEFDYEGYAARQGVYVTAFIADDSVLELIERPGSDWLAEWRRGVGVLIDEQLADPERQVLRALIIGDTAGVPQALQQAFIAAGVNHVLSISGLHIGMVAAFGYVLWRWVLGRSRWLLLRTNVPKLAVTASVIPVLLYAGIAGSNPATIRSVIMVLVFLGAVVADRQRDLLVSLAAAALLISLAWPGAVLDISFQLSFVAVLFLFLGMNGFWPWWRQWEERRLVRLRRGAIRYARPVAAYLAVSLCALLGTAPLTAFHFNQVSWVALLANAVVVPLLGTVAVALGLAAALTYPASATLAALWVRLAWPSLWLGDRLVELFAALPQATLRVVTPSLLELVLLYGGLLALFCLRARWRVAALGVVAAVALLDAGWWYRERFDRADLRVTFLSVGQGDSAVVECPSSAVLVIDGGGVGDGSFDLGERVIAPFLWGRKIARIDTVAMSHPQWDHYGGLTFLARQFAPRQFWSTGAVEDSPHFAALDDALRAAAVQRVVLQPGMELGCGEATVRVLTPVLATQSINDQSLVLQVQWGAARLLFTGDIERAAEEALVTAQNGSLPSAVLKVPHHGSSTSSTPALVAAVAPRLAVASVGADNRFGFPHQRTIATYARLGVRLLQTGRDGAVTVTSDRTGGFIVQVERQVPGDTERRPSRVDSLWGWVYGF